MYIYKKLTDISDSIIVECFNLSFFDYLIPVQLTDEQFKSWFTMSGVDKNLSFGAFYNAQMVGFIFNSCNIYNGDKVVFDVGTGVVPQHRGNKVFTNLYKFAEQQLKANNIEKYYLEVLQQNDKAIHSYKKQGFNIIREFSVLKKSDCLKEYINECAKDTNLVDFDFNKVNHCTTVKPSYEHCTSVLKVNSNLFAVTYIEKKNKITAFCITSKGSGSIIQLGYTDINDLKEIIQYLCSKFNVVSAKNIDISYIKVLEMLIELGFCEITKQYEMVKKLV